ncbi:arylsulfatase [Aurantiacibacter xanthus]|uniref:Arylsulfatase n=1 Tax=Aurantiacibacter xanthus TaxID=1784712 RepID=A0A3A1PIG9_9SPHN|nr:arylsulfatase [Aurantiacibacter xanthus]RIV93356.1 arylsulfatase [Aurantiacibacter xanthus]
MMAAPTFRSGATRLRRALGSSAMALALASTAGTALHAQQTVDAPARADGFRYFPKPAEAPAGAPNVLVVLTDDVGFSAASGLGGPIPTPAFDSVMQNGITYTRFHVTAMCSPTRASLLTGRNHHAVGFGAIANVAVDEPGYTSVIPESAATIGDVLKMNGYSTAFFGKNHNTPEWETGPFGPFERWPNGFGFDYFYGFNGPAADQINPELVENRNTLRRDPTDETYFLDRDLADHMVDWIHMQDSLQEHKPFLLYFAPGTMHAPQQAPKEWIAKFAGQFDQGWDVLREQIFARQKAMGIIPANAEMAPRPERMPSWDSLTDSQRHNYAHLMEVAAAQMAYMDFQFGRVLDALRETGELDNTLILYVQGDNGGAIHELAGSMNAYEGFAQIESTDEELTARMGDAGGENSFGNYPAGWAFALNTPFPWGKAVASHLGGTRNALAVSWPSHIAERGAIRTQYTHVIDLAPTIYEAIGITPPAVVDGVEQQPIDGKSFAASFTDAAAPEVRHEQYYEMLGSRAYYKDGWLAATGVTWDPWRIPDYDPNSLPWELYNLDADFSQVHNIASQHPDKLAELQADFDTAARRYNVFPLASDYLARLSPSNRPHAVEPSDSYTYYPGDARYPIAAWPNVTPNWEATVRLTTNSAADSGPVFGMGMRFTGYRLALEEGVPVFTYDPTGREEERMTVRAASPLPAGEHTVAVRFAPEAGGVRLALSVDGQEVDTANDDRFYRVFNGAALIGRPLIDDRTGPRACECSIESVTINPR